MEKNKIIIENFLRTILEAGSFASFMQQSHKLVGELNEKLASNAHLSNLHGSVINIPLDDFDFVYTTNINKELDKIEDSSIEKYLNIEIPLDLSLMRKYLDELFKNYSEHKKEYQSALQWYSDYSNYIFKSFDNESDACLFLAAIAFTSPSNPLQNNLREAARLFASVKKDYSNSDTRDLLFALAKDPLFKNVTKNLELLKQYSDKGSYYAKMLAPKHPKSDTEYIKFDITNMGSKLKNFNLFIEYYINNRGHLTKDELIKELLNPNSKFSGNKVISFLINLLDPKFEYRNDKSKTPDVVLQPGTIDRWMIRLFFERPISILIEFFKKNKFIADSSDTNTIKKKIFDALQSDSKLKQACLAELNYITKKLSNSETGKLFVHEIQAYLWVKIRNEFSNKENSDVKTFFDAEQLELGLIPNLSNKNNVKLPDALQVLQNKNIKTIDKIITQASLISNAIKLDDMSNLLGYKDIQLVFNPTQIKSKSIEQNKKQPLIKKNLKIYYKRVGEKSPFSVEIRLGKKILDVVQGERQEGIAKLLTRANQYFDKHGIELIRNAFKINPIRIDDPNDDDNREK